MFDDTQLLNALAAAPEEEWEHIYANTPSELDVDGVYRALQSRHPAGGWLSLRIHATRPGTALPDTAEAIRKVWEGEGGRAEAYAAMFGKHRLPAEPEVVALLINAAVRCLDDNGRFLTARLAGAAALAAFVAGDTLRFSAWMEVDAKIDFPFFQPLRVLLPLLKHPDLSTDADIRSAAAGHWQRFAVPSIPDLPAPTPTDRRRRDGLLAQVGESAGDEVATWITQGWARADVIMADALESTPYVQAIRDAVLRGDTSLPEGPPPTSLRVWAAVAQVRQQHAAARLAALALLDTDDDREGLEHMILQDLRVEDVCRLVDGPPGPIRDALAELNELLPLVPTEIAERLVKVLWPTNPDCLDAAAALLPKRGVLAALASPSRPWLRTTHAWLDDLASTIAAAERPNAAFLTQVDHLLTSMPTASAWTEDLLNSKAREIGDATATDDAWRATLGSASDSSATLLLAVGWMSHRDPAAPPTSALYAACRAILDVEARALMPLRATLLEQLIRTTKDMRERAWAMLALVNTRNGMAKGDLDQHRANQTLMIGAAALAREFGDLTLLVDALTMRARFLVGSGLLSEPGSDSLKADADADLTDLLRLGLPDPLRGTIAWARSALTRDGGPAGDAADYAKTIELLEEASSLLDDGPWRLDASRELAHAYSVAGRRAEAVALLNRLLDPIPAYATRTDIGLLHGSVARLVQSEAPDDADRHFREALRQLPQSPERGEVCLHYASFLHGGGKHRDAMDLLTQADALRPASIAPDRRAHEQLRASILRSTGRHDEAELAARAAMAAAQGTVWEAIDRAQEAQRHGDTNALDAALHDFMGRPLGAPREANDAFASIVRQVADQLPVASVRQIEAWAEAHGQHALQAQLSTARGDLPGAALAVRRGIESETNPVDRACMRILLLGALQANDSDEYRAAVDAAEADIDPSMDLPVNALHDLAEACRLTTRGDRNWSNRALWHAERAFDGAKGTSTLVTECADLWCRTLRDRITLERPTSSPTVARRVREAQRALPYATQKELRKLAEALLLPGPLLHHEELEAAGSVLSLLEAHPKSAMLTERHRVLVATQLGGKFEPLPPIDAGPADILHGTWVAALGHGVARDASSNAWMPSHELVVLAIRTRPDLADAILTEVLVRASRLPTPDMAVWADLMQALVLAGAQGRDVWPRLFGTVQASSETHSSVLRLRKALRTARGDSSASEADQLDAEEAFRRAAEAMIEAQRAAPDDRLRELKAHAIENVLVALSAWRGTPQEVDAVLSLGNAKRMRPDPDLDGAIAQYEYAATFDAGNGATLGKLHKVWADALRQRGRPEDIRAAWDHAQIAIEHRPAGWLRAEAKLAAALTADVHPDWPEDRRAVEACRQLLSAVEEDAKKLEPMIEWLQQRLAIWSRARPDDQELKRTFERLILLYPGHAASLTHAASGMARGPLGAPAMSTTEMDDFAVLFLDPDFKCVIDAEMAVAGAAGVREQRAPSHVRDSVMPDGLQKLASRLAKENATPRLNERLASLSKGPTTAGKLVAKVVVLAELARRGQCEVDEVRRASADAAQAVRDSGASTTLVVHFLDRLAHVWAPDNDLSDPVRDFPYAAALLREAVLLAGGEDKTPTAVLAGLGRALRYADDGNRAEPRRLFEVALQRKRAAGDGDGAANLLVLLAEMSAHGAEGHLLDRLRASEVLEREALTLATTPGIQRLAAGNLAWTLTKIAEHLERQPAEQVLQEALTFFALARSFGASGMAIDNNETVCRQQVAARSGDPNAPVQLWRDRIAQLGEGAHPLELAMARHNLANALHRRDAPGDLSEAGPILESALAARLNGPNRRHVWETAVELARGTLARLRGRDRTATRPAAADAARTAIRAARELGGGEELANAALLLGRIAQTHEKADALARLADEAWGGIAEALPQLLLDRKLARAAAEWARGIAFRLADLEGSAGITGALPGGFMLGRSASERVATWLLRSDIAFHWTRAATLAVPSSVPSGTRARWLRAIRTGDGASLPALLAEVRSHAPDWLAGDVSLDATKRWLASERGSVALAVWPAERGFLAVAIDGDSGRVAAMVLEAQTPDLTAEEAAVCLRTTEQRSTVLTGLVRWAQRDVVARIVRAIGTMPRRILWAPHGLLRMVPPARVFPGTPVSCASSLALSDRRADRARDGRPVVIVADPGDRGARLGPAAVEGALRIQFALGDSRLILSDGRRFGAAVHPTAEEVPASAAQVLRELDQARVAVVIAHGTVEDDDAWIELIGADGKVEALHAGQLAEDHRVVEGLSLVLLSCETGNAGSAVDRPGGIAGALIMAGATEVVAPLWPVQVHSAVAVGEVVAAALAAHASGASALAEMLQPTGGASPQLGPISGASQEAASWDTAAFVSWVG